MKQKIKNILIKVDEGAIPVSQALADILNLHNKEQLRFINWVSNEPDFNINSDDVKEIIDDWELHNSEIWKKIEKKFKVNNMEKDGILANVSLKNDLGQFFLIQLKQHGLMTEEEINTKSMSGGGLDVTEALSLTLQREIQIGNINGISESLDLLGNIIKLVSETGNDMELGCKVRKLLNDSNKKS